MKLKSYYVRKMAEFLAGLGLVEIRKKDYEGYGITTRGLDLLALKSLSGFVDIKRIARRFDVGKEADIHICYAMDNTPYIIKVFRLGRTSFKKVRAVRPGYDISTGGWIVLNIRAAGKEYDILQKLWNAGVSVPKPLMRSYHLILMEYIPGKELHKAEILDPLGVFREIVHEVLKAYYLAGVVHADLSEYNVLINEDTLEIWLIDWPQWLSTDHEEAGEYLKKDIEQIMRFFCRKFRLSTETLWSIFQREYSSFREKYQANRSGEAHKEIFLEEP